VVVLLVTSSLPNADDRSAGADVCIGELDMYDNVVFVALVTFDNVHALAYVHGVASKYVPNEDQPTVIKITMKYATFTQNKHLFNPFSPIPGVIDMIIVKNIPSNNPNAPSTINQDCNFNCPGTSQYESFKVSPPIIKRANPNAIMDKHNVIFAMNDTHQYTESLRIAQPM